MQDIFANKLFLTNPAIRNSKNIQSLKASTYTTYGDEDKAKAEPLLTLPFREKRV